MAEIKRLSPLYGYGVCVKIIFFDRKYNDISFLIFFVVSFVPKPNGWKASDEHRKKALS